MVNGLPFVFDGVPSETYNASLVFVSNNYTSRSSGSEKKVITETVGRKQSQIYLDTQYTSVLSFDVEIYFDDPQDIYTLTALKDWLCKPTGYSRLQICAEYSQDYYYNCYITPKNDIQYIGGFIGIQATVTCDSPFAYSFEQTEEHYLSNNSVTFDFDNISLDFELLLPTIAFFNGSSLTDISMNIKSYSPIKYSVFKNNTELVKNISYDQCVAYCDLHDISLNDVTISNTVVYDKTTTFTDVLASDTLICDSEHCTFECNTTNIVQKFNKIFPKFPTGRSVVTVTGGITKVIVQYKNAMRLGGGYY